MAQVFIPDNPREREQLQGTVTTQEVSYAAMRPARPARRFGVIDLLLLILSLLAAIAFLITAATRWAAPLTPSVSIFYQPGLEYDVQLLSLGAHAAQRPARSCYHRAPAPLAALLYPGTAILDDRLDLEQSNTIQHF